IPHIVLIRPSSSRKPPCPHTGQRSPPPWPGAGPTGGCGTGSGEPHGGTDASSGYGGVVTQPSCRRGRAGARSAAGHLCPPNDSSSPSVVRGEQSRGPGGAVRDDTLAELVRDRGAALLKHATLLAGTRRGAEDLVQDALVKVFAARRGRVRDLDSLDGYVRRTVTTLFLDSYRRPRRWVKVRHMLAGPDTEPPDEDVARAVDVTAALRRAHAAGTGVRRAALLRRPHRAADRRGARARAGHGQALP